jgi:Domain of Unknown Function with PDB structure (DUF3857)/Transglutaminase-like superfamily
MRPGALAAAVYAGAFAFVLLAPLARGASQQKDVPSWVQEVSSRTMPAYPGKTPAAVLLNEERAVVDAAGVMTVTTRTAIKILTHEGQREAVAEDYYFAGGRKIKQLRAWLVAPDGFIKTYDKNSVADLGAFEQMELYNDIRIRRIKEENPEIGAVFAYESEVEQRSLFAQEEYLFQKELPAVQSRYVLTLPTGWTASAVLFNHEPIQPVIEGSTYTWELKDLPFREPEEHAPSARGLVPRLAVDFRPPANTTVYAKCFRSWADVARWHAQLAAGQDEASAVIAAKTRELTVNASSEYAKIRAIGRYVQSIKYVAIEMDESHGGGYKPHAADAVFRKQYGDCKDKANLMRAMLKAAGIESYLVAIFAGDRTFVREDWPSPQQFNHMILAVRISEKLDAPTVIASEAGPLLIFDPTSETTPMGDLPWFEQGSFALLCAGEHGALLKMPATKPEANLMDVTVDATLSGAGDLIASISSKRTGQSADALRQEHFHGTADQFRAELERTLARTAKAAAISNLNVQDAFEENAFHMKLDLASRGFGQLMQDRLLVFSPSILEPPGPNFSHRLQRTAPIVLRAAMYRKHTHVQLPPGFTVDEMPEAAEIESGFARFTLTFHQEADALVVDEELTTQAVTLPAEEYANVKKFFDRFDGADQQRAVLVKSGS